MQHLPTSKKIWVSRQSYNVSIKWIFIVIINDVKMQNKNTHRHTM